jgi:hypothetical protein
MRIPEMETRVRERDVGTMDETFKRRRARSVASDGEERSWEGMAYFCREYRST